MQTECQNTRWSQQYCDCFCGKTLFFAIAFYLLLLESTSHPSHGDKRKILWTSLILVKKEKKKKKRLKSVHRGVFIAILSNSMDSLLNMIGKKDSIWDENMGWFP